MIWLGGVSRKLSYRHHVVCDKWNQELNSDKINDHKKVKDKGQDVHFTIEHNAKQSRLSFGFTPSIDNGSKSDIKTNFELPTLGSIGVFQTLGQVGVSAPLKSECEINDITDQDNHLGNTTNSPTLDEGEERVISNKDKHTKYDGAPCLSQPIISQFVFNSIIQDGVHKAQGQLNPVPTQPGAWANLPWNGRPDEKKSWRG